MSTYRELDTIPIPEDVPEAGITAGMPSTVVEVLPDGRLLVDVVDEEGYTLDMLYIAPDPVPTVDDRWRVGES